MKKTTLSLLFAGLMALILGSTLQASEFKLDASHTMVAFKVKHLGISTVTGRFKKFEGGFNVDDKTGKVADLNVKIDVDSIDTDDAKRDDHLKSKDFFNESENPQIEFKSTKIEMNGKKVSKIHGDLKIHGVTKSVILNVVDKGSVTDPWGNHRLVFEASGKVSRKDFGMTWNKKLDKGGLLVGDDVKIEITGEAIQPKKES